MYSLNQQSFPVLTEEYLLTCKYTYISDQYKRYSNKYTRIVFLHIKTASVYIALVYRLINTH